MQGYVVRKGNRYYAVIYSGIHPIRLYAMKRGAGP